MEFTGYPPPVIQWFREGFEIQTSRDFQIMTTPTRSTLYIPEVFPEDTGIFTVKIHNPHGMAQCKANLQVQGALRWAIKVHCCLLDFHKKVQLEMSKRETQWFGE